jgi:O-antigen ligase
VRLAPLDAESVVIYGLWFLAVAIAMRRRPAFGIAALIACVPFGLHRDLGPTTLTLSKIGIVAAFAGLVWRRAAFGVLGAPAARALLVAGGLVLAATALSIVRAEFTFPVLREVVKAAGYLALFAVVVVAARDDPADDPVRRAFATTLIVVSALALAEEFGGARSGFWFAAHPIPRIAGPLEGPNQLAGYLGIGLAVVVAYALAHRRDALETVALAFGSAALVLTVSRAGLFGAVVGCGIVAAVSPRKNRRRILPPALAGAALGFVVLAAWGYAATHSLAGFDLLERFSNVAEADRPGAVGDRSQLWRAAIELWRTQPLLGIGAGNFERELGRAGFPQLHTHANSLYLQALAEGGLVLLAATLGLTVVSIARFTRGPFRAPLVAAALGASSGFAAHQLFDLLVFFPKVGELWWIVLALGAARVDAARRAKPPLA